MPSSLARPALSDSQHADFVQQLCHVVQCCGDWPAPSPHVVALLEPLLRVDMRVLVSRARRAASCRCRGSVGESRLTVQDVLLACGRDRYLVARVVTFFRQRAQRSVAQQNEGGGGDKHSRAARVLAQVVAFVGRMRVEPVAPGEDHALLAQSRRLDILTQLMNPAEYQEFARLRSQRFHLDSGWRLWLRKAVCRGLQLRMPADVTELLLFLARDLATRLADACFLVAEDEGGGPAFLESGTLLSSRPAVIQPKHLFEAVRRLQAARKGTQISLILR